MFCNTREAVRHLQATLLERGFSVVALSGELTQNERTQALQALRDGRARVCVATDVAARGIDLPNLDLVIHADLPNDPEVMQHRSGRTGRAGRKGVSILLVPPARKRRAEVLLNLAGIDAIWGTAPQPDEIRKLDQERMLKDELFAAETTPEDLVLAQALLAERSAEEIAAALARLYRARLPSPEDIIDPGEGGSIPRGAAAKGARPSAQEAARIMPRHGMAEEQRLVQCRDRADEECRSALAVADDVPPRRHRQVRHRRHPHPGHHHRDSRFPRGSRNLRRQDPSSRQGRQHPHRADEGCAAPDAPRQEVREKEWTAKAARQKRKGLRQAGV